MNTILRPKSIRVILLCLFFFLLINISNIGYAQEIINLPEGVHIEASGTGQTTGEIVSLLIANERDEPFLLCISHGSCDFDTGTILNTGMMFIPSQGKYQSYIVTGPNYIEVPPNSSNEYSLEGYCSDIHTPPVPVAVTIQDFDTWIFQGDTNYNPATTPDFTVDFTGVKLVEKNSQQTYITNIPPNDNLDPNLTVQLDLNKNPSVSAPFIFDAFTRIENTVDELLNNDLISTPFHADTIKERETLIQQTVWLYTSTITGEDYTKEDFSVVITSQAEDEGLVPEDLPERQQRQFNEAIDNFWSAFTLIGVEAKVLNFDNQKPPIAIGKKPASPRAIIGATAGGRKAAKNDKLGDTLGGGVAGAAGGLASGINPKENKKNNAAATGIKSGIKSAAKGIGANVPPKEKQKKEDQQEPLEEEEQADEEMKCECGYISFYVNVKANDGKYDRFFEVVGDFTSSNGNPQEEIKVEGLKVKAGDQIEITISDVNVECNCSFGGVGECLPYKPKKDYSDNERDTRSEPGEYKIFPGIGSSTIPMVKNNKDNSEHTIEFPEESEFDEFTHIVGISAVCAPDFCGEESVNCVSYAILTFDAPENK
jgi:hypothetical protein